MKTLNVKTFDSPYDLSTFVNTEQVVVVSICSKFSSHTYNSEYVLFFNFK